MIFLVIIPEAVYEELKSVFAYYEERQIGLGTRLLDDWESTMEHLEKRPFIHPVQFKNFRSIKFNHFPFLVIYKVEHENIVLYKLIHARRHPTKRFKP